MAFYANKMVNKRLEENINKNTGEDGDEETSFLLSENAEKLKENLSKGIPSDASTA